MDQPGGDSHCIHLPHQGTDPFFIPEDIGEIRELASYIVVGDAQVIPISMPSGEDVEVSPPPIDLSFIPSIPHAQQIANPGALHKGEWRYGSTIYRVGDKVMQTQNTEEISNGDIGQVTEITMQPDGSREMRVSFGDIARNYQEEELAMLDDAYATSVHKSQGGEYPVVIIPVLKCFYPMLKRNVYYTGVTRAKMRVHLVGSWQALAIAISNTDAGKRNTLLAVRLQKEMERLGMVPSVAA